MRSIILFLLINLTVLLCCSFLDKQTNWIKSSMYTLEVTIPDSVDIGQIITYEVKSYLPNSCWKYSHIGLSSSDFDVYVTLYMKRDPRDQICLDVITPVDIEGNFLPEVEGEYTFHFWRSDTSSLDTNVIVR